jgi:hypothetical protein
MLIMISAYHFGSAAFVLESTMAGKAWWRHD